MAFLEDTVGAVFEGGAATGIAIGAGALVLLPGLLPTIGRMVRPLAVAAIKTGMSVYNEASATVREMTEDIMAEARADLEADGRTTQDGRAASPVQSHTEHERRRPRPAEASAGD
jgi:Protein of unknown function (DUF5132)